MVTPLAVQSVTMPGLGAGDRPRFITLQCALPGSALSSRRLKQVVVDSRLLKSAQTAGLHKKARSSCRAVIFLVPRRSKRGKSAVRISPFRKSLPKCSSAPRTTSYSVMAAIPWPETTASRSATLRLVSMLSTMKGVLHNQAKAKRQTRLVSSLKALARWRRTKTWLRRTAPRLWRSGQLTLGRPQPGFVPWMRVCLEMSRRPQPSVVQRMWVCLELPRCAMMI